MSSLEAIGGMDTAPAGGRIVCIGVFDGVHLGHQRIVSEAVAEASANGAVATVVTFSPHPEEVLRRGSGPALLTLPHRKTELLGSLGVEEVVSVKFDREFSELLPEAFCRSILSRRLGAKAVYVGENFHFGRHGSGRPEDLEVFGKSHGFVVRPIGLVYEDGEPVSSTRIRTLLGEGAVDRAATLLSRPHRLEGAVVHGAGRGRSVAAPTANLQVAEGLLVPAPGVYVTRTSIGGEGEWRSSVTSVGGNPTFESDGETHVETVVMGYEGDLYGSHLAVEFLQRLREQRKFTDAAALAEQIQVDIQNAAAVHEKWGSTLSS